MARYLAPAGFAPAASVRGARSTGSVLGRIALWLKVAAERRALAALPQERLADIGMSDHCAAVEAARPFWDAPSRR